jgi:cytochrome c oxidase assembly protein subunit 15
VVLPIVLVGLVILQGLLGMWTVTLLLKPLIVVLHLLGGLTTLSLLAWLACRAVAAGEWRNVRVLARRSRRGSIVLALQIALGGWTSSNYAALACPDFPTCQNSYWPQMDAKTRSCCGAASASTTKAACSITRRGSRFTSFASARCNRCALMLGFAASRCERLGPTRGVRIAGAALGAVLVCQRFSVPVMVIRALPLALATAHNAVAALL